MIIVLAFMRSSCGSCGYCSGYGHGYSSSSGGGADRVAKLLGEEKHILIAIDCDNYIDNFRGCDFGDVTGIVVMVVFGMLIV
ncbi:Hypothetical predicted protein [Octopus vulgaris]|uniref:Uncharacterized protein n=1 Tax=Octopus vulgaris TaxID=6645 RepID=A0AA36AZS0_OCTVU|nr:Hypothetical predicted protein [Octopus vulgaris]